MDGPLDLLSAAGVAGRGPGLESDWEGGAVEKIKRQARKQARRREEHEAQARQVAGEREEREKRAAQERPEHEKVPALSVREAPGFSGREAELYVSC